MWEKIFIFCSRIHHCEKMRCIPFLFLYLRTCTIAEILIFRQTICTFDIMLKDQV